MATKQDLQQWVLEAVRAHDGSAAPIDVARHIWQVHEAELRESGDLFYTWQYDMRWTAQVLRNEGVLRPMQRRRNEPWSLA